MEKFKSKQIQVSRPLGSWGKLEVSTSFTRRQWMQETTPNILCMSRAYGPPANSPKNIQELYTQVATLKDFSGICGILWHPRPWSGHSELLWPQLSAWPNIAVAPAGLSWQSLSLLGRGGVVFWVPCYHPEVLLTSCYHATDAPQTQHKNTSCGSESMFCQWSVASKIQEISRSPNNFWTASAFFFWSNVSGCCLSESIFATYPCSVKCNLQTLQGSRNPNSLSNHIKKKKICSNRTQHQTVQVSCQNGSIFGNMINKSSIIVNVNASCMRISNVFHAIIFDDSSGPTTCPSAWPQLRRWKIVVIANGLPSESIVTVVEKTETETSKKVILLLWNVQFHSISINSDSTLVRGCEVF